ncbi:MAG: hypothetical protein VE98_C0001G0522 [candidate division Kazan bacterium GW2011_GWA1_50_15]|uniref:Uncharacterized protein n=2 Tax=Bacteria division Kazan-3B-28 TaxID=1798534 RepID=A0A0G2A4N0_UNCK3|nr:MAG: hypothetical protein VE98_C0001G0522 [candidate division Kazan bacterium GW2011_GWA1_50_15]KKW25791.1 MAG: hypothetical protein VE99_C0001G0430 [candidate division Kazan bacterium GW2011_GWC1_52_13]KKW27194.1 MAG: hypothetical protein VF00_C0001G0129 [candidate division Kazan bacterium GW2011_GWB1_52_7]HCR42484.1 hypothetical protein [Patescibacteria group bacterium]
MRNSFERPPGEQPNDPSGKEGESSPRLNWGSNSEDTAKHLAKSVAGWAQRQLENLRAEEQRHEQEHQNRSEVKKQVRETEQAGQERQSKIRTAKQEYQKRLKEESAKFHETPQEYRAQEQEIKGMSQAELDAHTEKYNRNREALNDIYDQYYRPKEVKNADKSKQLVTDIIPKYQRILDKAFAGDFHRVMNDENYAKELAQRLQVREFLYAEQVGKVREAELGKSQVKVVIQEGEKPDWKLETEEAKIKHFQKRREETIKALASAPKGEFANRLNETMADLNRLFDDKGEPKVIDSPDKLQDLARKVNELIGINNLLEEHLNASLEQTIGAIQKIGGEWAGPENRGVLRDLLTEFVEDKTSAERLIGTIATLGGLTDEVSQNRLKSVLSAHLMTVADLTNELRKRPGTGPAANQAAA